MNVLITGANGQLGRELQSVLRRGRADIGAVPAVYADATVTAVDADQLDITDAQAVTAFFTKTCPDVVFNCAAYTQVDACEENEADAARVNADGPAHLAAAAARIGAKLVHVSTDYVFDGAACEPYDEDAPTAPATAYGRTKQRGEQAVLAACDRVFVVRTAWLYGTEGHNFVATMRRLGASRDTVTVVDDQTGSPTYTEDLAWTLLALGATEHYGVYHATGAGSCTWCAFARAIMERAGNGCRVLPCTTAEYPSKTPRPAYSVLGHKALAAIGLDRIRPWEDALDAYFARTKNEG
ncbi:MAG: dTDP-4-dehydrorhamnose reductase [Clostridia bacterium]|nr:dTDP-4-dehydrorhamnose reductase [Clostridia bacterium]